MEVEELRAKLEELAKVQAKTLNLLTKIAKTLHLVTVTEKEERSIQVLQRKNAEIQQRVYDEVADKLNLNEEKVYQPGISELLANTADNSALFGDVLAEDLL